MPYGVPTNIPVGGIIMWSGLSTAVPAGWLLCNGALGTPDLRARFIRGCAPGTEPGVGVGGDTHQHATAGDHGHAGVADHNHGDILYGTSDLHDHTNWGTQMVDPGAGGAQVSVLTSISGTAPNVVVGCPNDGAHAHANAGDHQHAAANSRPANHELHFIIRVW